MIKTKGERVSPKEIESALSEVEGVVEAAVIGVPDDIFGHAIKVFIVGDRSVNITEEKILRYCQQNLESFMVPKYVEICDRLPRTSSGKIDKKKLANSQVDWVE